MNQYNWKEIGFSLHKKDWKKLESNNKSIALIVLYVPYNTKEKRLAIKSKHNLKRKNHVILLIITDNKIWHHLSVTELSGLFRGKTSKIRET